MERNPAALKNLNGLARWPCRRLHLSIPFLIPALQVGNDFTPRKGLGRPLLGIVR
jgi:hypothetical protein